MSAAADKARDARRLELAKRFVYRPDELKKNATRARTQATLIGQLVDRSRELLTPEEQGQLADAALLLGGLANALQGVIPVAKRLRREMDADEAARQAIQDIARTRAWLAVPEAQLLATAIDLARVCPRFSGAEGKAWWVAQGHDAYRFEIPEPLVRQVFANLYATKPDDLLSALGALLRALDPRAQWSMRNVTTEHLRRFWQQDCQRRAIAGSQTQPSQRPPACPFEAAPGHFSPELAA